LIVVASILGAPIIRVGLSLFGNPIMGPYTLLPSRADSLGVGVLIALACRNKKIWEWLAAHRQPLYVGFLLLGFGIAYLTKYDQYLYTVGISWIAAFYACLLLLVVVNPGKIESAIFGGQFLMKLGTISYAVYIFHQGINRVLHFAILGETSNIDSWSSLSIRLLSLITVLLLATLSWKLFEKPLIRRAHAIYRF
jgi:peptidoglycan/LPS O-acetylase OafA/YrhL